MIRIPDLWKIYLFLFLGMGVGYMGAFDSRNFLIFGLPVLMLLKNTEFNCYTDKIRYERQKNIQIGLVTFRDLIDLARNFDPNNMEVLKEKVQNILRNVMGGMDVQSLFSTGISSLISSLQ